MRLLRHAVAAGLLAALCVAAAAAAPGMAMRLQRFKLANGLEGIVAEDHRLPQVALNLWVNAGPRWPTPWSLPPAAATSTATATSIAAATA